MNLPELLKNVPKSSLTQQEVTSIWYFLQANKEIVEYYKANEWNGDTYVILKWSHKVQGLVVLP